jgi:hypothetical protein
MQSDYEKDPQKWDRMVIANPTLSSPNNSATPSPINTKPAMKVVDISDSDESEKPYRKPRPLIKEKVLKRQRSAKEIEASSALSHFQKKISSPSPLSSPRLRPSTPTDSPQPLRQSLYRSVSSEFGTVCSLSLSLSLNSQRMNCFQNDIRYVCVLLFLLILRLIDE